MATMQNSLCPCGSGKKYKRCCLGKPPWIIDQVTRQVANLGMDIQLDNKMRQIKGSQFERRVIAQIASDCPNVTQPIKPGLALRKIGQKDSFAEVDLYLYLQTGDFLFLVDCKAYSLTREYFRGDRRDVQNRWELIRQWISKGDKRAAELAKTPIGANYRIPKTVKYLVPVVCSACPEFFGSVDDSLFIVPRKIPRVCTYDELVQTVRNPQRLELANRPFTISIDSE